jgi:hypothetical protein
LACASGLVALLVACGGGGGDVGSAGANNTPQQQQPAPAAGTTVAGLYFGTASGGRTLDVLLMPTGHVYAMLGAGTGITSVFFGGGPVTASGFVSSSGGHMSTGSGNPLVAGELSLIGLPRSSISGTLAGTGAGFPAPFTASYSTAFEGSASLANLAGTYQGDSAGLGRVINATLTVDAAGLITGESPADHCTLSGSLTPEASANVLALSITFGTGCPQRGTMTGHALWRAAAGATPAALTLLASAGDSGGAFAQGWVFFGSRP